MVEVIIEEKHQPSVINYLEYHPLNSKRLMDQSIMMFHLYRNENNAEESQTVLLDPVQNQ